MNLKTLPFIALQMGLDQLIQNNHDITEDWKHAHQTPTEYLLDFLNGDLNLMPANLEGAQTTINQDNSITFDTEQDLEILNRIAGMTDEQHMELFAKYELFHDGGDDLDYAGSYYSILTEIIAATMKLSS